MSEILSIAVKTPSRGYDILIGAGLLQKAGEKISSLRPGAKVFVIADQMVDSLHGDTLRRALHECGITYTTIPIASGEASKSFAVLEDVSAGLVAHHIERGDVIIAFGGGVIGDLAGFAAAVTLRGIDVVHIPTTLLSQVDSSIGGKTGINLPQGKNLIGAFHQPLLVLSDPAVLDTLPGRQLRNGYAEIVKAALINDAAFFTRLESAGLQVLKAGMARNEAIAQACRIKAGIVARDEFETNERMLLNLGHTFGHAWEALAGFSDALLHGEAVAIGIAQAFRFSQKLGLCPEAETNRVENHLNAMGLATYIPRPLASSVNCDKVLDLMSKDKKMRGGQMTLILAKAIGSAFIAKHVEHAALKLFLDDELSAAL